MCLNFYTSRFSNVSAWTLQSNRSGKLDTSQTFHTSLSQEPEVCSSGYCEQQAISALGGDGFYKPNAVSHEMWSGIRC